MPTAATTDAGSAPGLRERKNRRTRLAIVRATAELSLEVGYAATTIPRIAERADVSPRTVSTWFPAKDDILFDGIDVTIERATQHLRGGAGDVVERLGAWLADESGRDRGDPDLWRLRETAIAQDPDLRLLAQQHLERVQREIVTAAARDVGRLPTDIGPQAFGGAAVAFLFALRAIGLDGGDPTPQVAEGMAFLRAGLAALTSARG